MLQQAVSQSGEFWAHLEIFSGTVGTVLIPLYIVWRSDKKERKTMHQENQSKLNNLLEAEKYLPQHYHQEKEGPLHADGIIRKIENGGRT